MGGGPLFFYFVLAEYSATPPDSYGQRGVYKRCTFTQHVVENLVIRYVIISWSQNPKKEKENRHQSKAGNECYVCFSPKAMATTNTTIIQFAFCHFY